MVYHAIGTMSGSSIDGLDIVYCTLEEIGGKWTFQIHQGECISFDMEWSERLRGVQQVTAKELILTHTDFGQWMGKAIKGFIEKYALEHKVHLIASHGHTVFHEPQLGMTFQMGDGASIAAINKLPVVSDLRNMDVALGGQGAPIVPIGEKILWNEYRYFLNIGGISNITVADENNYIAFDVCPANRVLNLLSNTIEKPYDKNGDEARKGKLNTELLNELNALSYYTKPAPKSLSNEFGTEVIMNILDKYSISVQDKLHSMCVHIVAQIRRAISTYAIPQKSAMLVSGGGAFNLYLIEMLTQELARIDVEVVIPEPELIHYKEALVMALIGVLRWREESNVLASVTGAMRNSVGGALWMGQD